MQESSHQSKTSAPSSGNAREATAAPLGPDERRKLSAAFEAWRRRLLDLTKRNRAINYKPQRVATVTVVDERPAEVFRQLLDDEVSFSFKAILPASGGPGRQRPIASATDAMVDEAVEPDASDVPPPTFTPYAATDLRPEHRDTVLQCKATPESLDLSLRRLSDVQRSSLEEQGVNTLYLALGFLHYTEAAHAETMLKAPLVLVPVRLDRKSAQAGYRLSLGEDEPMLNPSLAEYLRRFHELVLPALPEQTEESGAPDLQAYFRSVQAAVAHCTSWRVTEEIALTPLAFQKLVMFRDLEQNESAFIHHGLLQRIVLRQDAPEVGLPQDIATMELDVDYPPERTHTVMDADSSQLQAIAAVERGYDLVVHGPPGTGKSQTITNLISQALGAGKRVLFVSEKTAALEVVSRRLADAGLGSFCLELHSVKSNKADALASVKAAIAEAHKGADGTPTVSPLLPAVRHKLNRYVHDLHAPRTQGSESVYAVVGRYARTLDAPRIPYPGDPRTLSSSSLQGVLLQARQTDAAGAHVGEVTTHGWRDAMCLSLPEDVIDAVRRSTDAAVEASDQFVSSARGLADTFGVAEPLTLGDVTTARALADLLSQSPGWPIALLQDRDKPKALAAVRSLVEEGRRVAALSKRYEDRYDLAVVGTPDQHDVAHMRGKASGFFGPIAVLLDGECRRIKREWHGARRPGVTLSLLEQASDYARIPQWLADRATLDANINGPSWFGNAWHGAASHWPSLASRVAWLEEFFTKLTAYANADAAVACAARGGEPTALSTSLKAAADAIEGEVPHLCSLVAWPAGYLERHVKDARARVLELAADLERGPTWAAFVSAVHAMKAGPGAPMAEAALRGVIPATSVAASFERGYAAEWLKRIVPDVDCLREFSHATHETARREFQKLDGSVFIEHRGRVKERIRGNAQSRFKSSSASHRQFLNKETSKQKRHRPLRVTMTEAYDAIRAVKPCFLMSPLSVAQFLPAKADFDLVVFDEASQLPTEDAVGAIARGAQLVVVGDPKQLPPTNFFSAQTGAVSSDRDDEGNVILEETESVLEECLSAGLHQQHLQWHYRSAHEHLIQFSNEKFYGDSLLVYPAAAYEGPDLGVQFVHVEDGYYAGGGLNPIEARRVAEAVVAHFRDHPDLTLGVGTFNMRQQNAILDELERLRRDDPSLEEFFQRDRHEPFFVKNLENIQGDERDVIFLSVTYARTNDGILRYNFGPLNRDNGWRRLNVLVSRARKRMRVFSSLRAGDIDPNATATKGPELLRDFLLFAETGRIKHHEASVGATESPFEAHVMMALQEADYIVDPQVGVGKYRIDLGIRHRSRPGIYIAGVECDGAAYHTAACARDRDRLRQAVLEDRGWTIVRIWSTDWFKDRTGTLERLLRTLDVLREGAAVGTTNGGVSPRPSPSSSLHIATPAIRQS